MVVLFVLKNEAAYYVGLFSSNERFFISIGARKIIYKSIPYIYHNYSAQEDLYALFIHNANIQKLSRLVLLSWHILIKCLKGARHKFHGLDEREFVLGKLRILKRLLK